MIDNNIDIGMVPSKQLKSAVEMKISDILDSKHDNHTHVLCKFNATVKEVLRKERICYRACSKCNKKVDIYAKLIYCERCVAYQNTFTYRYFLQLLLEFENTMTKGKENKNESSSHSKNADQTENSRGTGKSSVQYVDSCSTIDKEDRNKSSVQPGDSSSTIDEEDRKLTYSGENTITVKLFESAKYLLGCTADVYMASVEEKPEISPYYKKLIAAEGQQYTFLVKNYCNIDEGKRNKEMVIEEMQLAGHAGVVDVEQAITSKASSGKRLLQTGK